MTRNSNNEPEFYVVQFLDMPFEGIDDYVCLPDTWLMSSRARKEAVIVTYPTNEDPMATRKRVKRKERYNKEWKYYMAAIKYESDTYSDAEQWIAAINDCRPLVINESETTDTQQIIPLNEKSQSSNENYSSKFINVSWKPQPRPSIKRAVPSEPKKQFVGKRLKLDDAAQSSTITDANKVSKREQLIIIQDNQSIECTQEEKAAAASTINQSTEQRTQDQHTAQNKQALSLPVKDISELPEVMNQSINEENHSQGIKEPDKNKSTSESHLFSNATDSRCITKKFVQPMPAEESSAPTEQTTQPNQYDNQEHILVSRNLSSNLQPQIENFPSLANVHNDEIRNHKVSNNLKSTPILNSVDHCLQFKNFEAQRLVSTQRPAEKEICPMNIKENVAAQKPSNLMDQAAAASTINESTEQKTQDQHSEQNKQALSLPVKDINELPEVMDQSINEENHSQGIKTPDRNKSTSESHLFSNATDSRCITKKFVQSIPAEESSAPTEQTTQPNQYDNQEHILVSRNLSSNLQPQIENFPSLANVHNDEIRNHKVSNNLKSTPILNSVDHCLQFKNFEAKRLVSTQRPAEKEICPMNIKENVAAQKPSNLMDQAAAASTINESTEQKTQDQHTEQNKQALSLPVKDINELPEVMDQSINEENHSQGIKKPDRNKSTSECHIFSNATDSRCITKKLVQSMPAEESSTPTEQTTQPNQYDNQEHILVSRNLSSNFQPQIENFPSIANVHNDEIRNHKVSNNLKSTPILSSVDHCLQFKNFKARRLVSTQRPAEKEICPMNIKENVAAQKPSNLMDQTASSSARSKNHSQDGLLVRETYTGNSKVQIGPLGSITVSLEETQQHVPKTNAQPHNMTFVDPRNGFQSASDIYTLENLLRSHQNPYQLTNPNSFEQDLLEESKESNTCRNRQITRIRTPSIGQNSTNPSNPLYLTSKPQEIQPQPYQQDIQRQPQIPKGIAKKTMPPILTKVPNSLLTTHNKCLQNEHKLQANRSKRAPVNENHLNVIGHVRQIDKWMEGETLSSYHGVNLISNVVTDHEASMSTNDSPMGTTNNFFGNEMTSGKKSVDRPIASQNSTFPTHQTNSKVILKRKMLEKFKNLFAQMNSTLRYTREMYQTLQSSMNDIAELYKQVKDAVEEYNKAGNACHTSNLTQEAPQFPSERNSQVPKRANSCNDNRYSNDVANKVAKKQTQ